MPRVSKCCKVCKKHFSHFTSNGPGIYCSTACHYLGSRIPLAVRFWSKVKKSNSCWTWRGGHRKGYPAIATSSTFNSPAHRVAWQLTYGNISKGLLVLHKCDNRGCVNPKHLFLGTNFDNTQDAKLKHRLAEGEQHGMAKLTRSKVELIRTLYKPGTTTHKQLAKMFNISKSTIGQIVNYRTWN